MAGDIIEAPFKPTSADLGLGKSIARPRHAAPRNKSPFKPRHAEGDELVIAVPSAFLLGLHRDKLCVPLPHLFGIAFVNMLADAHAFDDRSARIRAPLGHIGVEQDLICEAPQNEIELPGEVMGVAEARAQSLRQEWGHLMRRIAGEEHPSDPPLRCIERLEFVGGDADQFKFVRRRALRPVEPAPYALGLYRLLGRFVRERS